MKKSFIFVIFLFFVSSLNLFAAVNMLPSTGFARYDFDEVGATWYEWGTTSSITNSTTFARSGTRSCKITDPTTAYGARDVASETVTVTAGTDYSCTIYAYIDSAQGGAVTDVSIGLRIKWYDNTNTELSEDNSLGLQLSSFDSWEALSMHNVTAPVNATKARFIFDPKETAGAHNVYFDDGEFTLSAAAGSLSVSITSPADNHDTTSSSIVISGGSTNSSAGDSVGIYVDGTWNDSVTVDGSGDWSGTAAISGLGHTIVAYIYSGADTATDTITVNYNDTNILFVYNWGMETAGPGAEQSVKYWYEWGTTGSISQSSAQAYTGSNSLLMDALTGSSGGRTVASETVSVSADYEYKVQAYFYVTINVTDKDIFLKIKWIDGSGNEISTSSSSALHVGSAATWELLSYTAQAPSNAATARFIIDPLENTNDDAGVYADNAEMIKLSIPDYTVPTITVNDDSYVVKALTSSGYGPLFDIDFSDNNIIDTVYLNVNGANTATLTIIDNVASYTANWQMPDAIYDLLSTFQTQYTINITAVDTAGNSAFSSFYIKSEKVTFDGDISSDWHIEEGLDETNNDSFYITWDDTSVYFAYLGDNGDLTSEGDFFVYLKTSNAADGSTTSYDWNGYGTHTLPFSAEYMIGLESTGDSQFRKYTGGSWQLQSGVNTDFYCGNAGAKVTEFRIGWDRLGGRPANGTDAFYVAAFHQSESSSNIVNIYPLSNPAGTTGVTMTDYYKFADMADTMPQSSQKFDKLNIAISPSSAEVGTNFLITLWATNANGDTLTGYSSDIVLTVSHGATLSVTSATLVNGESIISDSITGVAGDLVCTAAFSNNLNKTCTASITITLPQGSLKITEVMVNQPGAENIYEYEYIEIYNSSDVSIDISILQVDDDLTEASAESIQTLDSGLVLSSADTNTSILAPYKYAVIIDNSYTSVSEKYVFSSDAIIMKSQNVNLFGSGLDTTEDISIWLSGIMMDSFPTQGDPGDGIAWDRVDTATATYTAGNWVKSTIAYNNGSYYGTPGDSYDTVPGIPSALSPSGEDTGATTIYFSWTHNDNAGKYKTTQTRYQVQVDDNSDFSSPEIDSVSNSSNTYASLSGASEGVSNYWRVRTWSRSDYLDTGAWSDGTDTFMIVGGTGFGTAEITSPVSFAVGQTGISLKIKITSSFPTEVMDTITVTLPANLTWSGSADDISFSGAGFDGGESKSVSGSGTSADSYIITILSSAITNTNSGTVTISNVSLTGGASSMDANGTFTVIIKTASSGNQPASISSQPQMFVSVSKGTILISEIAVTGSTSVSSEFVELWNTSDYCINLEKFSLEYDAAGDASVSWNVKRRFGYARIEGKSYYLLGTTDYNSAYTNIQADTTFAAGFPTAGGAVRLADICGNDIDIFGWGTADTYEASVYNTSLPSDYENKSFERKAYDTSTITTMAEGGTDSIMGNGDDDDNNSGDFITISSPDPQNTSSSPEPTIYGAVNVSPNMRIAASGKGSFIFTYSAGITALNDTDIYIVIPSSWTTPQKSNSSAAGYVTVTTNGSYTSYTADGVNDTIVISGVTLNAGSGRLYVTYGDTDNGNNAPAAYAQAGNAGYYDFKSYIEIDAGELTLLPSPSLTAANVDTITFIPSINPRSFIGSYYPMTTLAKDSNLNVLYGARLTIEILNPGDGTDSAIAEYSNNVYDAGGDSNTRISYTNTIGKTQVFFYLDDTENEHQIKVSWTDNAGSPFSIYSDSPTPPIPVISEIAWDGTSGYEYIEFYNPTNEYVDLGTTGDSYQLTDNGGTIITSVNFNNIVIPPYGYAIVHSGAVPKYDYYAVKDSSVVELSGQSLEFTDDPGEHLKTYRYTGNAFQFVDQHGYSGMPDWLGYEDYPGGFNSANGAYVSVERKWISRAGNLDFSWYYTSSNSYFSFAGTTAGKGTPGSANSRNLYNSTISLCSQSDSVTNTRDSVPIVVNLKLNSGDTVRYHYVALESDKSSDTFTHWYDGSDSFYTDENGYCTVYVWATESGVSEISVDTPEGVVTAELGSTKKTVSITFDFDSPVITAISSEDMKDTALNDSMTVNCSISDALSGVASAQVRFSWDTGITWLNGWLNMTNSSGSTWTYDTFSTNWFAHSGCTITYQIKATDKAGCDTYSGNFYEYVDIIPDPTLKITYPHISSHDTSVQVITISGTTDETEVGDTVYIYLNDYSSVHSIDTLTVVNQDFSGTVCLTGYDFTDNIIVKIENASTGKSSYDTITVTLNASWGDTALTISEIMFDTSAYGTADWIEFHNTTHSTVNVNGWKLGRPGYQVFSALSNTNISAKEYVIIASSRTGFDSYSYGNYDSSVIIISDLDLNDSADTIALYSSPTVKRAQMYYNRNYGASSADSGKSLELYNPRRTYNSSSVSYTTMNANADTCAVSQNGTPGIANSVAIKRYGFIYGENYIIENTTSASVAESSFGDTIAGLYARLTLTNSDDTVAGYQLNIKSDTGYFTNSTGASNLGTSITVYTDSTGIATFYFTAADPCEAIISCTVTQSGYSIPFDNTYKVYVHEYSGIKFGFSGIDTFLIVPAFDAQHMMLYPTLAPNGKDCAYLYKNGTDSFGITILNTDNGSTTVVLNPGSFNSSTAFMNNMSRISYVGAAGDKIAFTAWKKEGNFWYSRVYLVDSDGSQSGSSVSDFETANRVLYSGQSVKIMNADFQPGTDTFASSYGSRLSGRYQLRVRSASNFDSGFASLTGSGLITSGSYWNYFVGQPKFSPDGNKLAFVLFKFASDGAFTDDERDVNVADIYVINDWKAVAASGTQINSRADARLTKLTDETKFCWNPSWNADGSMVTWSQCDSGTFNFREFYNEPGKINGVPENSLNDKGFATYMRYVDSSGAAPYEVQQMSSASGEGNQYLFDWGPGGDTMISLIRTDEGFVLLRMRSENEAYINENGGILFDGGKTTLVVPHTETLAVNTKIGVKDVDYAAFTDTATQSDTMIVLSGSAREYYPGGTSFSETATLILYYDESDLDNIVSYVNSKFGTDFSSGAEINGTPYETFMNIYWWNPETLTYENYGGAVDPTDNDAAGYKGKIYAKTTHFSKYAIGFAAEWDGDSSYFIVSDTAAENGNGDSVFVILNLRNSIGDTVIGNYAVINTDNSADTVLYVTPSGNLSSDSQVSDSFGKIYAYVQTSRYGNLTLSVNGMTDTQIISFYQMPRNLSNSVVSSNVLAGETAYLNLSIYDNAGNLYAAADTVNIEISSDLSDSSITYSVNNSNGYCTFTVYSEKTGYISFDTVSVNGLLNTGLSSQNIINFRAAAADSTLSSVICDTSAVTIADGIDSKIIQVYLKDRFNNNVQSETVSFSSSRGTLIDTILPAQNITNTLGYALAYVSSSYAGTMTVTVQPLNLSFDIFLHSGSPYDTNTVIESVNSGNVIANNSAYKQIRITLKDSTDNIVAGEEVQILTDRGDTVIAVSDTVTNMSGQIDFYVKSIVSGTATVYISKPAGMSKSYAFRFVSGPLSKFGINIQKSSFDIGGESVALTLNALDYYNNITDNFDTEVNLSVTNGITVNPDTILLSDGIANTQISFYSPITVDSFALTISYGIYKGETSGLTIYDNSKPVITNVEIFGMAGMISGYVGTNDTQVKITAVITDNSDSISINAYLFYANDTYNANTVYDTVTKAAEWIFDISSAQLVSGDTLSYRIYAVDSASNDSSAESSIMLANKVSGFSINSLTNDTAVITSSNGELTVTIPPGSIKQGLSGNIIFSIEKDSISQSKLNKIAAANSKYANKIQYSFSTYADKYYEINVYLNNVSNNISSDFLEPGKYVIIKFNYSSSINPMEAQTLKVITLDENNSEWIRSDINQENDYTSKTISAYINHFSIWSYAPSVFSDLSQLIVYPNPWNINTAGIVSETVNYGVKFYGLPKNSNVKIYTVAGEKVYQGTNGTVDTLVWNLRNAEGVKVASGVYLYVVDYNGQKVTGKIAVIK